MIKLRNVAIRPKLMLLLLLVGMLPLIMTGLFATRIASNALMDKAFQQLETILQSKKSRVEAFLTERLSDLDVMASETMIIEAMEHFHLVFHRFEQNKMEIGNGQWEKNLNPRFVQRVEEYRKIHEYSDILFLDKEGNIVYTAARGSDLGSNVTLGNMKETPLRKLYEKAQLTKAIQDFEPYAPYGFRHASFVGTQLKKDGQSLGTIVFRMPTATINKIMSERSGMGQTGETYLVGKHEGIISYRSDRVVKEGKIGQPKNAPYVTKALSGVKGHEISHGSLGEMELHAYLSLDLAGLDWAVIGSIDQDEVDNPIDDLAKIIFVLASLLAALVVVTAVFFSRTVARPLQAMNEAANRIANGDWSTRVDLDGEDELGQLASSFNRMAQSNEEQFWIKSSVAQLTTVIQMSDSPKDFSSSLISKLPALLSCGHGVVYTLDADKKHYRLLASYGYKERKNLSNTFAPGEGLVGQCALEKKTILLTDVPGDHVVITTGLGNSPPLAILALPLLFQEEVLAVIELASFTPFTASQKSLLEELMPALGLGLENINRHQKTNLLLQETQRQAEELDSQSEEMRLANEALHLQSEKVRQANEELQARNAEVQHANQALLTNQEELHAQQAAMEQANQELHKARLEVERKATDLETANRYKSQFLANMSHELRTPLNSLLILAKGFSENEDGNLTKDQVESARIIFDSGTDLLELINDILDLSKIETGKMDVHIEAMILAELADSIRTQFKHVARAKKVNWQVTVAEGTPFSIETDVGKVRQIIKNFLSNSFKFTEKGSVAVEVAPQADGWISIAVTDTGIGIPKEKHGLVFEAFQQADGGTSRRYGGTGLGLSIVRELAKLLRGEVLLTSEEGKGSTFTLLLPAVYDRRKRGDNPVTPPPPPPPPPTARIRVAEKEKVEDDRDALTAGEPMLLVVEDDPNFATIVRNQIRRHGHKCLIADTGESGLQLAIQHLPMGIILDRLLPDMDGQELLAKLQENPITRRIPVHIISVMERQLSLGKGAMGVLEKPVSKDQIRKVLEQFDCQIKERQPQLLLVEDDANSRKVTTKSLEKDGIKVVAVSSCEEAFQLLRRDTFDCMILDLSLPDCSGFEMLRQITHDPLIQKPPVVIYSGKELSKEEYLRLRQYTDAVVTKGTPDSSERLAKEVGAFLQNMLPSPPAPSQSDGDAGKNWQDIFKNTCILLVDDDVRNTFALSRALEKKGISVVMAPDGQTALDLLDHSPRTIDAVLMDVMMPGLDGNQVTRQIRQKKNLKKLPIIGLSAKAMVDDQQRSLECGMDIFLSKPVDLEQLLTQLHNLTSWGSKP